MRRKLLYYLSRNRSMKFKYIDLLRKIQAYRNGTTSTSVMDREWDHLIVVDACRYDLFTEHSTLNPSDVRKVESIGTATNEWAQKSFPGQYDDTIFISGHPYTSSMKLEEHYGELPFYDHEDVWLNEWSEELGTVPPEPVLEAAKRHHDEHPDKRTISHFLQPHHPFIGEVTITETGIVADQGVGTDSIENTVWGQYNRNEVTREEMWEAYASNMEYIDQFVEELAAHQDGRTVVTSDHGNLFGEYFLSAHPPRLRVPELTDVPWAVM